MKWGVLIVVFLMSAPTFGQGYEAWVQREFPAAYEQFQECLPMTVHWQAQSGDPVQAEAWREGGDTYLKTDAPIVSKGGAGTEIVTIVDVGSDGRINRATMKGQSISSEEAQQYPALEFMLHTVVAVSSHTDQCGRHE